MKMRLSKASVAVGSVAALVTGGTVMAATGTLPGAPTSDAKPINAQPAPQVPQVPAVPQPEVPAVPQPEVPAVPQPEVPAADNAAGKAPGKAGVPEAGKGCKYIPPAVTVGSNVERTFSLTSGLHFKEVKTGGVTISGGRKLCQVTQTWALRIKDESLRVITLKVPSRTKLTQIAKAVRMVKPESADVGGDTALSGSSSGDRNGFGLLWRQHQDTAVYVSGGSALPGGAMGKVKLIAETLQRLG
jgi:hypothetical protein